MREIRLSIKHSIPSNHRQKCKSKDIYYSKHIIWRFTLNLHDAKWMNEVKKKFAKSPHFSSVLQVTGPSRGVVWPLTEPGWPPGEWRCARSSPGAPWRTTGLLRVSRTSPADKNNFLYLQDQPVLWFLALKSTRSILKTQSGICQLESNKCPNKIQILTTYSGFDRATQVFLLWRSIPSE